MKHLLLFSLLLSLSFSTLKAQDSIEVKGNPSPSFLDPLLYYQGEMDSSSLQILNAIEAWGDGCAHSHICCQVQCSCCRSGYPKGVIGTEPSSEKKKKGKKSSL